MFLVSGVKGSQELHGLSELSVPGARWSHIAVGLSHRLVSGAGWSMVRSLVLNGLWSWWVCGSVVGVKWSLELLVGCSLMLVVHGAKLSLTPLIFGVFGLLCFCVVFFGVSGSSGLWNELGLWCFWSLVFLVSDTANPIDTQPLRSL